MTNAATLENADSASELKKPPAKRATVEDLYPDRRPVLRVKLTAADAALPEAEKMAGEMAANFLSISRNEVIKEGRPLEVRNLFWDTGHKFLACVSPLALIASLDMFYQARVNGSLLCAAIGVVELGAAFGIGGYLRTQWSRLKEEVFKPEHDNDLIQRFETDETFRNKVIKSRLTGVQFKLEN